MRTIKLRQPHAALAVLGTSELCGAGTVPDLGDELRIKGGKWDGAWKDEYMPHVARIKDGALRALPQAQPGADLRACVVQVSGKRGDWEAWCKPA